MRAPRFFASFAVVLVLSLTGCSLLLDTDPSDPDPAADMGVGEFDFGQLDLGPPDLGALDAGTLDGNLPPDDAGCTSNAQCEDDVFCNGVEQCIAGTCVTTPVTCPNEDGIACTHPSCDATLDRCIETPTNALCAAGSYCDPTNGCTVLPDCTTDGGCIPPDACTAGTCTAGTCSFAPIDCTAVLPALDVGDCRVPSCDPSVGCVYMPTNTLCDDGVGCTADICSASGTCFAEPRPMRCDDGADCTIDACDPAFVCGIPGVPESGCAHSPSNSLCYLSRDAVIATYPGLGCATPVCIGASARNMTGCGFEGGCPWGSLCSGSSCTSPTADGTCVRPDDCSDGNPCNGIERCVSRPSLPSACAPSLTSACHPTPTGPSLVGTCALSPDATGTVLPMCIPPPPPCPGGV